MSMIARSWARFAGIPLVVICVLIACASPLAAQHFCFAQMTDIHFGQNDSAARAAKAVDNINHLQIKIDCVVVTGDVINAGATDTAAVEAGLSTMKVLKPPVHYVAGNHDVLTDDKLAATQAAFTKSFGPLASKAEVAEIIVERVAALLE